MPIHQVLLNLFGYSLEELSSLVEPSGTPSIISYERAICFANRVDDVLL